jgi:glycosyltransferase involved in cell wall biosynthesis
MPVLPTVTIAIPTYNRVAYLRRAIQSALSQTYPLLQVIVSDNCSDDETAEAVSAIRDPRLMFLRQEKNLGMVGNWNECLKHATGEWFLLLSDDDYLEEQAAEKLVGALEWSEDPERIGMVYCRTWEVDRHDRKRSIDPIPPLREEARDFALQYFLGNRKMHPCSTLLRTADLRQIGGYTQDSVVLAVDAMVWSRILLKRGLIAGVADALSSYRIHPARTTTSHQTEVWQKDIERLIELWSQAFHDSSAAVRHQFHYAARKYESWEMAAIINQSAGSPRGRIRAIGIYYACRRSFAGPIGKLNLLVGIAKLLLPEFLKRPIRTFLMWREGLST